MPTVLGLTNQSSGNSNTNNTQTTSTSSNNSSSNMSSSGQGKKGRLDTIWKRNNATGKEMDTLLWRALCDEPETALEYMADDCAIVNPILTGSSEPLSGKKEIEKTLSGLEPFRGYKMKDLKVVQIDLMAVACIYRVTISLPGQDDVEAVASSSWRQTAGADWFLCGHSVGYAD